MGLKLPLSSMTWEDVLKTASLEHEALASLLQRISVAVQHANYLAVRGTLPNYNEDLNCSLFKIIIIITFLIVIIIRTGQDKNKT